MNFMHRHELDSLIVYPATQRYPQATAMACWPGHRTDPPYVFLPVI